MNFDKIPPMPAGPKTTSVEVPHWGGSVTLRKLTAAEYIHFNTRFESMATPSGEITNPSNLGAAMLFLVVTTALDDSNARLFDSPEKIEKLNSDNDALIILGQKAITFNQREAPAPKNEEPNPSPNLE